MVCFLSHFNGVFTQGSHIGGLRVELHQVWVNARDPGAATVDSSEDEAASGMRTPPTQTEWMSPGRNKRGQRRVGRQSPGPRCAYVQICVSTPRMCSHVVMTLLLFWGGAGVATQIKSGQWLNLIFN